MKKELGVFLVAVSFLNNLSNTIGTILIDLELPNNSERSLRDVQEMVVSSQSVVISKRSDVSELENLSTEMPKKKKPKLYSWWMPNMTMNNGGPGSPTTSTEPTTISESQNELEDFTTISPSSGLRPKPTRRPKPTKRPLTKRPTTTITGSQPSDLPTTASVIHTTTKTLTTTPITILETTTPRSFIDPYGVKRKIIKVAKTVGGVALKAAGAVGSLAVGASGGGTLIKVAGKVGSAAVSVAGQAGSLAVTAAEQLAPVAQDIARQAGSIAVSTASQAGSLAANAAGRAYKAVSNKVSPTAATDNKNKKVSDDETGSGTDMEKECEKMPPVMSKDSDDTKGIATSASDETDLAVSNRAEVFVIFVTFGLHHLFSRIVS